MVWGELSFSLDEQSNVDGDAEEKKSTASSDASLLSAWGDFLFHSFESHARPDPIIRVPERKVS